MDILYTHPDTALLYHFVDAISPFLTFDPLPRYLVVRPPDSTHGGEQMGKAVASIQYTLEKIADLNDMTMPTILIMLFSEINPKDLNARSTSGDEYYGLFEKAATCSKTIYLLIPPRMILGQSHQLDIEDLIAYDGVQLIRSYKEHQAISAFKAVVSAYKSIRLRLTAMQKRVIKRNEALIAQYMQEVREEAYNDLDTCEDSCMRHASANLHIPRMLETSDDVRAYIEDEHISVSPIQRRYLYSMDPAYQYLKEVEDKEKNKQSSRSVHFAFQVGSRDEPLASAPPETLACQFRKRLFQTQKAEMESLALNDKLSASPSFAQTCFNLQSICSDVQALSNTSVQVDYDWDTNTKDLIQMTHVASDVFTPFIENLSQAGVSQRSLSQPLKLTKFQSTDCGFSSEREQLSNSHVASVAGLASAVHAFEIPFDPQSSVQNRAASFRLIDKPMQSSVPDNLSVLINPRSMPTSIPPLKQRHCSLLTTDGSHTSVRESLRLLTPYEEDQELQYTLVSAESMNQYNAKLLSLHFRVNNWEDLDICQRIDLVKAIIRYLYLPDFCHVCCKDKAKFGRAISDTPPLPTDNITTQLEQRDGSEEDSEPLQNILVEYRKTLSAKGLLRNEAQHNFYHYSGEAEAVFTARNRPTTTYSIPKSSRGRVRKPPPILPPSAASSTRLNCELMSRSMSSDTKQNKHPSIAKTIRSISTGVSQPSHCTPDPTFIRDWSVHPEKADSLSHEDTVEQKDMMIGKMGAQMASFVTYCRFSCEHRRHLPAIREIVSSFMHSISTTTSFELESTAVYCPNCSIFLGCCKRCATVFARSHQAECANFVAFKIFSRMNDRQLEDCCRFEESQPTQKVPRIESSEANRLRKILADFDTIALRDMSILQNYTDEKPKVTEGESDIIKDYREQQLGTLSYTDNQINSFQQQGDVILEKVHGIIKQKNEKYSSVKDNMCLPQIPEDITAELTRALTDNDSNALHKALRSLLEQRRVCSDILVSDIKDINLHNKGQEHNLTTFFTNLIDLLRAQYQHNLDELHIQQEHAIHDRFLAVTADLRLCSLLEVLKQDILGCVAKLTQKRFNPMLTDLTLSTPGRRYKKLSISAEDVPYTNVYCAMKDLAAGLLAKEKTDQRRRRTSEVKGNTTYGLDISSNVCTESMESLGSFSTDGYQNQDAVTRSFEESTPLDNKSYPTLPLFTHEKIESENRDSEDRTSQLLLSPRTNIRRITPRRSLEQSHKLLVDSSITTSSYEVTKEPSTGILTVDPYRQYLIRQLPRHLHQELINARSYLGFRRPNSTVISFAPEVYAALEKQDGVVIILSSATRDLSNEGATSPRLCGSALSQSYATGNDSEEEAVLDYAVLTYNSIYMLQPDPLLAIDELQHILGQSEFFYNDVVDIIAQYSAQLRAQQKVTQIKSAIKKELYTSAKLSHQGRHGGEGIKITNQEVEYEYIKRYGHDMRKFIFSFPKTHSEMLYADNIEAMKAIMDSLLPLYQHTQIYLSKVQSSVQRLERTVKDKRALLRKTSTNLDKVSSTHRSLSELVIAVEIKLRQKQLLFEKALSASPSPTRVPNHSKQLDDVDMSLPRLSVKDLYSASASASSMTSYTASAHSQNRDTLKDTDILLDKCIDGSLHMIYSQGLAPKGLKGSLNNSLPFNQNTQDKKPSAKSHTPGLPSLVAPGILQPSATPKEAPCKPSRSMSLNTSSANPTEPFTSPSKDKGTKSDGDDSHPATIRMVARRMRRGGRKVVLTSKKSHKLHVSEECSDYEFNPDDMLGLSSITVPSDKLQQEASTAGELVDMTDCLYRATRRRILPPLSQRSSSKEKRTRELFSASEVMELYRLDDGQPSAKSDPSTRSRPKRVRVVPRKASKAKENKLDKDRQVQQMLTSLENFWRQDGIPSSQKHDLFSSSSDTELDTLTVVIDIEKELDYMKQINPPITQSYESATCSGATEDFSETVMQIQKDLHMLSPDPATSMSSRKPRTNIPPKSISPHTKREYRQKQPSRPSLSPPGNTESGHIANINLYFPKQVANDVNEIENPSGLASIGSLLFSQYELSNKYNSKVSLSDTTSDPPQLLNSLRDEPATLANQDSPLPHPLIATNSNSQVTDNKTSRQYPQFSPKHRLPPENEVIATEIDFKALNLSGIHKQINADTKNKLQPAFPNQLCTASIASNPIPECQDANFQASMRRLNSAQSRNTSQLRRLLYQRKDIPVDAAFPQLVDSYDSVAHEDAAHQETEDRSHTCNVLERYKQFRQTYAHSRSIQHPAVAQTNPSPLKREEKAKSSSLHTSLKLIEKLPKHSRIIASSGHAVDEVNDEVIATSSSTEGFEMSIDSTTESSTLLIGVSLHMKNHPNTAISVPSTGEAKQYTRSQRSNLQLLDLSSDSSETAEAPAYRFLPDPSLLQYEDMDDSTSEQLQSSSSIKGNTHHNVTPERGVSPLRNVMRAPDKSVNTQNIVGMDNAALLPPPPPRAPPPSMSSRRVHLINLPGPPTGSAPAYQSLSGLVLTHDDIPHGVTPPFSASHETLVNTDDGSHLINEPIESLPITSGSHTVTSVIHQEELDRSSRYIDSYNRLRLLGHTALGRTSGLQVQHNTLSGTGGEDVSDSATIYSVFGSVYTLDLADLQSNSTSPSEQIYSLAQRELEESNAMMDLFVELLNDIYMTEKPLEAFQQLVKVRTDLSKYKVRGIRMITRLMTAQSLEVPQCPTGDFAIFIRKLNLFRGNGYPFTFNNYAIMWCNFITKYITICRHVDFLIANCLYEDIKIIDIHPSALSVGPSTAHENIDLLSPTPRFNFKHLSPAERRLYLGLSSTSLLHKGSG